MLPTTNGVVGRFEGLQSVPLEPVQWWAAQGTHVFVLLSTVPIPPPPCRDTNPGVVFVLPEVGLDLRHRSFSKKLPVYNLFPFLHFPSTWPFRSQMGRLATPRLSRGKLLTRKLLTNAVQHLAKMGSP